MTEQLDLFAQAAVAREAALVQVEEHADQDWFALALHVLHQVAVSQPDFISDDLWSTGLLPSTREDRALGPVFLRAARLGWIKKTNTTRPSVRSHLSGKPVWISLIYERNV